MLARSDRLPKIGVSVISLLPDSFGSSGVYRACKIARASGLDGIKAMPLRGWSSFTASARLALFKEHVLSYEGDWRFPNQPSGTYDIILFGASSSVRTCVTAFTQICTSATAIDLGEGTAVETSPIHSSDPDFYVQNRGGVCLDLWHVRHLALSAARIDTFIHELVEKDVVRSIDFQTRDRAELAAFLNGEPTELERLLKIAAPSKANVLIELPPWFLFPNRSALLTKLQQRIRAVIS